MITIHFKQVDRFLRRTKLVDNNAGNYVSNTSCFVGGTDKRKIGYETFEEANKMKLFYENKYKIKLKVYVCSECGKYHLTSYNKKRNKSRKFKFV